MPDPKGLAEAIATDLEAVGFTVNFKTAGWRTGYLGRRGRRASTRCGCSAGPATGPARTTSSNTGVLPLHSDGKPNPEFAYGPPELKAAFDAARSRRRTRPTAKAAWEQAQDILAARPPDRPARQLQAAGRRAKAYVKGFLGAGNLTESFNPSGSTSSRPST